MVFAEIKALLVSRAGRERKLTVLRVTSPQIWHSFESQETKHEGNP
jgi:hypothetical protein